MEFEGISCVKWADFGFEYSILTWYREYPDQQGGFSRTRHSIALRCADPCEYPKCGYLGYTIFGSGGLRSRYPLYNLNRIQS